MSSSSAADILSRIGGDRRRRIEDLKLATPGHVLRARLGSARPCGRLERALRRGTGAPLRLICEVKRASPSKGLLREDVDPGTIAAAYERGGAAAVSIVTEPDHFRGDLEWVNRARAAVQLPILLKDFIVDSWQILDAADRGADAVLLIVAMTSGAQLGRWINEARLLGLDCLVEVHDEDEVKAALRAGATVIGINNRDLRTFQVDPSTSLRLLPLLPPHVSAVAESGVQSPDDLARLRPTRCDAVLVGEALMTAPDPAAALATLAAAARG